MQTAHGSGRTALLAGWLLLAAAGVLYARQKQIPAAAAIPIVLAFLAEYSFYLVPGIEYWRGRVASLRPLARALFYLGGAVLPYLVYSIPTGKFTWMGLGWLVFLCAAICFWYLVPRPLPDLLFLLLLVAIVLSRVTHYIYASPIPRLPIDVLGNVMFMRLGILVMLVERRPLGTGFGFVPTLAEFRIGILYFFFLLPVCFSLAWTLGVLRLPMRRPGWSALAVLLGMFWVVALTEEFFFRGILQQWARRVTRNGGVGLVLASSLFGLCHLWFGKFPNWRMALVAGVAGMFYGLAFQKAGGIRASMVSHALTATAFRVLFS